MAAKKQDVKINRDVNAASRALLAVDLRRQGYGWVEVAQRCGYASAGAAHNAVHRELARNLATGVDEYRREEIDRLDTLLVAIWPQAVRQPEEVLEDDDEATAKAKRKGPDLWAIDRILAISKARRELLGLDVKPDPAMGMAPVRREYTVTR